MILLDPKLDPDPAPLRKAAAPVNAWRRDALPWARRLPTSRTLNRFLAEAQAAVPLRGTVTVLLTADKEIRRLNRDFRGIDKATDVLSFPAEPMPGPKAAELPAGDLAISVDTARQQAAEQGHALTCELKVLILHGLLHLAGYDHETDNGLMARRERLLRTKLGLPLGLIERSADDRKSSAAKNRTGKTQARIGRRGKPRSSRP